MDTPAARAFSSAPAWFLQVAARTEGRLDGVGLGAWSVRDLVGHTGRALSTVESYLDAAAGREPDVELSDAGAHYLAARGAVVDPDAVAERGRAAGAALGEDPVAALGVLAARVLIRVASTDGGALVATPFGVMTAEAYLPTRVVELVVHTCDLAAALDVEAAVPADAARVAFAELGSLAAGSGGAASALLALTGRRALPESCSLM